MKIEEETTGPSSIESNKIILSKYENNSLENKSTKSNSNRNDLEYQNSIDEPLNENDYNNEKKIHII